MTEKEGDFSVETRAQRHILARVLRGERLQAALHELAERHGLRTAWIRAIGAFEWIELTEYDQVRRRYENPHRFERCELLSMQGNLSERDGEPFWHLHATISVREGGHDRTYGGHVVDGVVFALEANVEAFDDVTLRRKDDSATGLQLWTKAERSGESDSPTTMEAERPAAVTWAMAAEVSARSDEPSDYDPPRRGDWLEHPKFGSCKIESLSGAGVCVIKLPDARRKKIKLDAMKVLAPRDEDGRRVFPVTSKPKG